MQYTDSESQALLRGTARSFLADTYPWERLYDIEAGRAALDARDLAQLAELGWLGLTVPEAQGGSGVALIEAAVVADELGYAGVPAPVSQTVVAGRILAAAGGGAADGLRALASGQRLVTVAEGSRARMRQGGRSPGPDSVTLAGGRMSGTLPLVPFADACSTVLAPLAIDGEPAFAALPLAGARLERRPLLDRRHFFHVRFDGQALDGSSVLARGDEARRLHERCDALSTAFALMELVGSMQRCLEMSAAYITERVQFGQPIAKFQAARHRAAELLMQTESSRLAAYHAIGMLDEDPDDASQVWLAKHWAVRAAERVYTITHLLHGGVGVGMDYPVHLFTLHVAGAAVRCGAMNELSDRIFESLRIPARAS
jgi:alkylation response protein AidB-like acyl-CoA dehydrogenase